MSSRGEWSLSTYIHTPHGVAQPLIRIATRAGPGVTLGAKDRVVAAVLAVFVGHKQHLV